MFKSIESLIFIEKSEDGNKILSNFGIANNDLVNGVIALFKFDLMEARDIFESALKTDKSNINLHFYYAVTCRELAQHKRYAVFQDKMFEKAKENFEWVISHDSTYKDIYFQYGLLLDYMGNTPSAIDNMINQIKLKPDLIEPYIGIRNIFMRNINGKKLKKAFYDNIFGNYSDISDTDYKDYLYAELLRILNREPEAEDLFVKLLQRNTKVPRTLIYNSLIKTYAELNEKEKLEKSFWNAVEEINSEWEADILFHNLKYISNSEEIQEYNSLSYLEKKNQFFNAFWDRHNPVPTTKNNPRIFEHYKRISYSEKNYHYIRERFYYSRCKFFEFTDQGLIYIRLGRPDNIVTSTTKPFELNSVGELNQSAHDQNLSFYEEDIVAAASNYQSSTIETWFYFPDNEYHFLGDRKKFLSYIVSNTHLEARVMLNPIYTRILDPRNDGEKGFLIEQKASENVKTITLGLSKEYSTFEKELKTVDIANSIYTFRGNIGKTAIDIAYIFDKSALYKDLSDSVNSVKCEINIGIYDKKWNQLALRSDTITINRPKNKSDMEFRFNKFNIDPDSCEIALAIHPLETNIYGKSKISLKLPDYLGKGLKISDVEIGDEKLTGSNIFRKSGKFLLPKVIQSHNLKQPLSAYFEIYNLQKNAIKETMYNIEYSIKYNGSENIVKKLLSSGNRTTTISTEYLRIAKEETAKEFISFDLNKLVPGKYVLMVKITDLNTKKSVTKERELELYENE